MKKHLAEALRQIGDTAGFWYRQHLALRPPFGTVAVGSAHFDPFLYSEALRELLQLVRQGLPLDNAAAGAKEHSRDVIRKWNNGGCKACVAIYGRSELHRSEMSGDAIIEAAVRKIAEALEKDAAESE